MPSRVMRWGAVVGLSVVLLVIVAGCGQPVPRFVTESGAPLAAQTVDLLCLSSQTDDDPQWRAIRIDREGRPTTDLPPGCAFVAAFQLVVQETSSKPDHGPAFRIFYTTWEPGGTEAVRPDGDLTVHQGRSLTLFDVVVSLAWEPVEAAYLDQLAAGFEQASAYLYDLTDGQMAFGRVQIYTGGRHWNGADFRVLAANDYRPSALVGGIVNDEVAHLLPPPSPAAGMTVVFLPGMIRTGRYWDGNSANDATLGRWDQPAAWRTLVHEWGHYALFFYDEYQTASNGAPTLCLCNDLVALDPSNTVCSSLTTDNAASPMAYHYTTSELWHPTDSAAPGCFTTAQWLAYGATDWEALDEWGGPLGLSVDPVALPTTPAAAWADPLGQWVTDVQVDPAAPTGGGPVPLAITGGPTGGTQLAHVFTQGQAPLVRADQIVHQGTLTQTTPGGPLGSMTLLGFEPDQERVRVFVDHYDPNGGRWVGSTYEDGTVALQPDPWQASIERGYAFDEANLVEMTITLRSDRPLQAPVARLCVPDAAIGCDGHWEQPMTSASSNGTVWQATFTALPDASELPPYSVLHVRAPAAGELMRWIQINGGVGPIHEWEPAPLRDGTLNVDAEALSFGGGATDLEAGTCSKVVVMPAADYGALTLPDSLEGVPLNLAGVPLDVDVLLPLIDGTCPDFGEGTHQLERPVRLTLFYDARDVPPGMQPLVLRYDPEQAGGWCHVPVNRPDDPRQADVAQQAPVQQQGDLPDCPDERGEPSGALRSLDALLDVSPEGNARQAGPAQQPGGDEPPRVQPPLDFVTTAPITRDGVYALFWVE